MAPIRTWSRFCAISVPLTAAERHGNRS